ncbi:helix-turn-helix transcriptional regulator [Candidatus Tisiphia endosymbiont of Oplodontha viridula]|uniref:helix-turn-helix transcriptional regulator n=1 Tax=Candidatus Tisiphia endosymbiont of Oplodontha viridula TaxID=3077925 RepID=UPI0035C8C2AD
MILIQQNKELFDITLSVMKPFIQIISPLKDLGINHFSYYKLFKDNKAFYICSDPIWHKAHYLSNNGFEGIVRSAYESTVNNINKVIFCGNPNKVFGITKTFFAPHKPMNGKKMFNFNLWNAVSYYIMHDYYFESFNFFGGNDQPKLQNFYETKDSYLRKFISYFLVHYQPLIQDIDQKYWVKVKEEQPSISKTLKRELIMYSIDGEIIRLSEKQYDILTYFAQGQAFKNVDMLGISTSTAEKYLNRLKVKVGCTSTEDLIRIWYDSIH